MNAFKAGSRQKSFKKQHSLEKRMAEAEKIRSKYRNRVPVIVERAARADIQDIDKKKYLVPGDLTIAQFTYVIRKSIKLTSEQALYVFVEVTENDSNSQILPPTSSTIDSIYHSYKDQDGFLYITYSGENVFGHSVATEAGDSQPSTEVPPTRDCRGIHTAAPTELVTPLCRLSGPRHGPRVGSACCTTPKPR